MHFYPKSVKSMPKAATLVNVLALFQTLFGSPWSLCPNATYISEKIYSLLLVKDHPGEIFSNLILSRWSPRQKRRPWVNFLALSQTLFGTPCPNATYISEKICSLLLTKDHPGEIFSNFILSPWSLCRKATYTLGWSVKRKHYFFYYARVDFGGTIYIKDISPVGIIWKRWGVSRKWPRRGYLKKIQMGLKTHFPFTFVEK
jgi:hypothetical protein